jgi:hypothetical protein
MPSSGCEMDNLAQDRDQQRAVMNTVMNIQVRSWEGRGWNILRGIELLVLQEQFNNPEPYSLLLLVIVLSASRRERERERERE